jgi:hypothetical protein
LLKTFNVDLKTNTRAVLNSRMRAKFVLRDIRFMILNLKQKRTQEATLSGLLDNMSPTAIFNRFDLSASNGQHCGEYRVIYLLFLSKNLPLQNSLLCLS